VVAGVSPSDAAGGRRRVSLGCCTRGMGTVGVVNEGGATTKLHGKLATKSHMCGRTSGQDLQYKGLATS